MQPRIMYIEHKTNQNDKGKAWIGKVEFSKTGQTVYFNNKAFKKLKSGGISGNHYDIETGDEYWISGVKKNGQDRHWARSGKIKIDENIIKEYLSMVDFKTINESTFEIINVPIEIKLNNKGIKKMKTDEIDVKFSTDNFNLENLKLVFQTIFKDSKRLKIKNKN